MEDMDLNLDKIKDKWLSPCGSCDADLPMTCSHPDEDYRPAMLDLVQEVERLREALAARGMGTHPSGWDSRFFRVGRKFKDEDPFMQMFRHVHSGEIKALRYDTVSPEWEPLFVYRGVAR